MASAQQSDFDVPMRYVDVRRTGLHDRFFFTFQFDTANELLDAVAGMQIDLPTLARCHDLRRMYNGWLYWFLYLKGYIQYTESGTVGNGNVYFDYLTRFYVGQDHDPGLRREVDDSHVVVERVVRRVRDVDLFRKNPVAGPNSWRDEVAPVRIIVSDPPPDNPLLVYEVGSDSPLNARLLDGWHRLFSARLFGIVHFPCIVEHENRQLSHVRGNIEDFSFDGRRLVIRGWCITGVDRHTDAVEVRVGQRTIGRSDITDRCGMKDSFGAALSTERLDFEIDCECCLPTNELIRFDILLLRDWVPVSAMVVSYRPRDV